MHFHGFTSECKGNTKHIITRDGMPGIYHTVNIIFIMEAFIIILIIRLRFKTYQSDTAKCTKLNKGDVEIIHKSPYIIHKEEKQNYI